MLRTTIHEIAEEVIEKLKIRNPNLLLTKGDIAEISYAINLVYADRIVKGERVQLKGLGNLFLEVNGATKKVIPGRGAVRIPARYNVDYTPAKEIENLFAGLPPIDHDFLEEEIAVINEGVPPVLTPDDLGGTDNPLPADGSPENFPQEEMEVSEDVVMEGDVSPKDGRLIGDAGFGDVPVVGTESPFPLEDPRFPDSDFAGKLEGAKKNAKKA